MQSNPCHLRIQTKMDKFRLNFCLQLGAFVLLQFLLHSGSAVKINSDGGYEVFVALDESAPVPSIGVDRYIENVKTALRTFSIQLWQVTKSRFHLKSVDILIPNHWNTGSSVSVATESFQTADIKLSPVFKYPHAENPNVCGQPGNYIELPDTFFNVSISGPYGLHWKSLLHVWALYRWGVHSEHGYVGDSKFPYTYMNLHTRQWEVTGCSDAAIPGRFVDVTDPENSCEADSTGIPNTCRFAPNTQGQNATTSLMHFHWIESVTEFCDEHTHNKNSLNKQNLLCDHRSVWEVIRETPDYLAATSPKNESVPAVAFRTVQHSGAPAFYLLIDRGLVQGSFVIANKLPPILATLFTNTGLQNNLAAIGAYPAGTGNNAVTDLVDWSLIGANRTAFLQAVGYLRNDGPLQRDFSRAIVEVADKIKQRNHPNGVVVLVVNYGADVDSFGSYLSEAEVLSTLNENNIILNSIELNFPNHTEISHLARIASGTGGGFTLLNNFGEAETAANNVVNHVRKTLFTEYADLKKNWRILRKESLFTQTNVPIPSLPSLKGPILLHISVANPNLTAANFSVSGHNATGSIVDRPVTFRMQKSLDWNQAGSKSTYKLEVAQAQLTDLAELSVKVECNALCFSKSIIARSEILYTADNVTIEVYTSLQDNLADLSSGQPVSIFAKIMKNGAPVQGAYVLANIEEMDSSLRSETQLLDNGEGSPDVQVLDGIYSAYFAPENDGRYKISVSVRGDPTRTVADNLPRRVDESAFTRLLPIDQGDLGCGAGSCNAEPIEGSFSQAADLTTPVSIVQAAAYIPSPTKILLLLASNQPIVDQALLTWPSPMIPGRLQLAVSSYEVRYSQSRELLVTDFESQPILPLPPNFTPQPPGRFERFSFTKPTVTTYYGIRSVYRGKYSKISNIAEYVVIVPTEEPTTTTTPPTGSPSTGSPPTGSPSTGSPPTGSPPTGSTDPPTTTPTTPSPPTPSPPTPSPPTPSPPTPSPPTPSPPTTPSPETSTPTVSTTTASAVIGRSSTVALLVLWVCLIMLI